MELSNMADEGWLVREERRTNSRAVIVVFYYLTGESILEKRQLIINRLLRTYLDSVVYPREELYVACKQHDLELIGLKRHAKSAERQVKQNSLRGFKNNL
ncbi:hypothetical protein N752_29010 [Desulforamulus aquiferis]|nr:hypothetical protein N752_29010 [Desulforamulus aquiferis]